MIHPSETPVPLGISPELVDVIRTAVATTAKPEGWRDSEYAMTKVSANEALRSITEAEAAHTQPRLTIFQWGVLKGEIARYWKHRRGPPRDMAFAAFTALEAGLRAAPEAKEALIELAAEEDAARRVVEAEMSLTVAQENLDRVRREQEERRRSTSERHRIS